MKFYYIIFSLLYVFVFQSVQSQTRISDFNINQYKNSIQINFVITPGNYCTGYDIYRSNDSINYQNIYNYPSVCGDLIKSQQMVYYDETPLKNIKSYYQVFVPPNNYSETLSITYYEFSKLGYILFSNPVTDVLKIYINNPYSTLKVFDLTGNQVKTYVADREGWINENITDIKSGLYIFSIETSDARKLSGKFIKH